MIAICEFLELKKKKKAGGMGSRGRAPVSQV
jgi:hypothetical protein